MPRVLTSCVTAAAAVAVLMPASNALAAGGGGGTATGADLQVSGSASTGSPNPGATYSYTFQVKNSGPQTADGVTFRDVLPAGARYLGATANGLASQCSMADGAGGQTVSCDLGSVAKGGQGSVVVAASAPITAGTFSNTGTATSAVSDPQPVNNSSTVNIQVRTVTCALPAGEPTVNGLVMAKYTNSSGLFENFLINVNGANYYVRTNFYDGTAPLTHVIDLSCKESPVQFIQVANFVNVTGTPDGTIVLPSWGEVAVLDASVVQAATFKDGP